MLLVSPHAAAHTGASKGTNNEEKPIDLADKRRLLISFVFIRSVCFCSRVSILQKHWSGHLRI
jgi:hypothetical protein